MGVDSILGQSSGNSLAYDVVDELKPVLNFGIGVEWLIGDAFSAYGSLVRDASSASEDPVSPFEFDQEVSNSISQEDGFYLGAGVSFQATWIRLTAGFSYGAREGSRMNPLSVGSNYFGQSAIGPTSLGLSTRRFRFLLGFTIPMVEVNDGTS
jgi:hypothetical protein